MLIESIHQIPELLMLLYCGIVIGIVYDILGILRKNKILLIVADIIFCIISLAICAAGFLIASEGNIRFYHILGLVLGFVLERWGIGPILKLIIDFISRTLYNLYKRIVSIPVVKKLLK